MSRSSTSEPSAAPAPSPTALRAWLEAYEAAAKVEEPVCLPVLERLLKGALAAKANAHLPILLTSGAAFAERIINVGGGAATLFSRCKQRC